MHLLNRTIYHHSPYRYINGNRPYSANKTNSYRHDIFRNRCVGWCNDTWDTSYGEPFGYLPPIGWILPETTGSLAVSAKHTQGCGDVNQVNLAGGVNIESDILSVAELDIVGGLLAGIIANLTASGQFSTNPLLAASVPIAVHIFGTGEINAASVFVLGPLAANITSTGGVSSANLNALVGIYAVVSGSSVTLPNLAAGLYVTSSQSGSSSLTDAALRAKGSVNAAIIVGDRPTANDIAQSILNAQKSSYNLTGTIGEAIGIASSGGMDPDLVNKIEELHEEAFGRWVIDPTANTMTLYKSNGDTLKVFNLTATGNEVPTYIERAVAE